LDLPAAARPVIGNMSKAANESYDLIRAMLAILQMGDSQDPMSLFTRYAEQIAARTSLEIEIASLGEPKLLSSRQIRQLFLIFREALNNIEKYADAAWVSGTFQWHPQQLTLTLSDNGAGFEPGAVESNGHYGLRFMRERTELLKGTFEVDSAPGRGTTIRVSVPYE
jgi:signal transduction histidine kinase